MDKILLLTDFSDNARSAIFYGLSLFNGKPVKFKLVHGMYLPYCKPNALALETDVRTEDARASFKTLLADINTEFPENHFDIETEVRCGELEEITTHLVNTNEINLVIMGTRGVSGLADVLMGTNTISVMEQVHCPVLAVPVTYKFQVPDKIVLAMDDGEGPAENVLNPLVKIAENFDSQVLVLHVSKDQKDKKELNYDKINDCLDSVRSHCLTIYDEDIANGLGGFVRDQKIQMLGMVKQKLNFFERVFHKSMSNKMVLQTDVPILIMSFKK